MKSQFELPCVIDGIQLTSEFSLSNLLQLFIYSFDYGNDEFRLCEKGCCSLGGVKSCYLDLHAYPKVKIPVLFVCPKGCSCHD